MFPRDIYIWRDFITLYENNFNSFDYDVKVGEGRTPLPEWDEETKHIQELLTRKRIDAVGYQDDNITVFEVKPEAGSTAIGQAISYAQLYIREFKPTLPVTPAIVTNEETPDTRFLCNLNGIILYIV